ncbi:MAG TPA: UDP-N-acetylglucosamine 2-epimerase (non-hydrolyzing) [Thermoanaerobaculia bacterium]|nr:UDP-N-acetylglucosamine 2-epimerase (non-hydrolyzing) [Thermoanaerobaculia bacterium]
MPQVLFVFGTRPEAIKLAPLIAELRRDPAFAVRICVTGQHREMLAQVLRLFDITPDVDLDVMQPGQELSEIAAAILAKLPAVLRETRPDVVVVQGDTTSAFAAGLAAFYAGIDVAHVEAGLRSGDSFSPWPEEVNRKLLSVVTRFHFAPTDEARANLVSEGIDPARIHVTGNTVIDALQQTVSRIAADDALRGRLDSEFAFLDRERRMILVTGHRRESFGAGLQSICDAVAEIASDHGDVDVVYPVHLNPNVRLPVHRILGGNARVHLVEPVDYLSFVHLMTRSDFILTDSGGVQEEASTLGKPVLVMRDTTERAEGVRAGNMRVVGTQRDAIVTEAKLLLRDPAHHQTMSRPCNAFGDGQACARIAAILRKETDASRRFLTQRVAAHADQQHEIAGQHP